MKDSKNPYNDSKKHPIQSTANAIADIENMVIGGLGFVFIFAAAIPAFKIGILFVVGLVFLSLMFLLEVFRALKSYNNKTLISENGRNPSKELQDKMDVNDNAIKKLNKFKLIFLLLFIVFTILHFIFPIKIGI